MFNRFWPIAFSLTLTSKCLLLHLYFHFNANVMVESGLFAITFLFPNDYIQRTLFLLKHVGLFTMNLSDFLVLWYMIFNIFFMNIWKCVFLGFGVKCIYIKTPLYLLYLSTSVMKFWKKYIKSPTLAVVWLNLRKCISRCINNINGYVFEGLCPVFIENKHLHMT